MLNLTDRGVAHTCDGVSRRDFLQVGTLGAVGLSLTDLAAMEAQAATAPNGKPGRDDRSVIMGGRNGVRNRFSRFKQVLPWNPWVNGK